VSVIRPVTDDDFDAVAAIYGHYVLSSPCTFELEPPTAATWLNHHHQNAATYPMWVATDGDRVVGYAKTGRFRERRAYDPSVEVSIYCAPDVHRKGVATALYTTLFDGLKAHPFHRAYAGITMPNDASVALHERFGFKLAGTFREVGRKFDQWWDVAWFEKEL
jgi:phosphinothricin acetyltransferase